MKKTNIRCKLGLFIGLLSLNTLSSCVNTRQTLGYSLWPCWPFQSEKEKKREELEKQYYESLNQNIIPKKPDCSWEKYLKIGGVLVVIGLGTAGSIWYYLHENSDPVSLEGTNRTASETALAVNNSLTSWIANGTKIAGTVGMGLLNATGIIAALKPNASNTSNYTAEPIPGGSTTFSPNMSPEKENGIINDIELGKQKWEKSEDSSTAEAPTLRTYENAISHVQKNNFSIESIQAYLDNGFGINQRDDKGATILMAAASYKMTLQSFEFLIANRVDVRKKDKRGRGVLMYIPDNSPESKLIFDFLVEKGAEVCIRYPNGQLMKPSPGVKPETVKLLSKEQKKKCS